MKKLYFVLIGFLVFGGVEAQVINFPTNGDGFKNFLISTSAANLRAKDLSGNYFAIDANGDGEIQISEALQVSYLYIPSTSGSNIYSLVGINEFLNLNYFSCSDAQLQSIGIDVHGLHYLQLFSISYSNINNATFYDLPALNTLAISNNFLTALDVSQVPSITLLNCYQNSITSLDLSMLHNLTDLTCNNNQLVSLNIKNGRNQIIHDGLMEGFSGTPTLRYLCVDDSEFAYIQNQVTSTSEGSNLVVINSYCSFIPGGDVFNIGGNTKFDFDANGCTNTDIDYPSLKLAVSDGTNTTTLIPDTTGAYHYAVQAGTQTITPILDNPTYYSITPSSTSITFPTATSPYTQNFCVTANGSHNDLEICFFPIFSARPGYDATYAIFYKNKGTDSQNCTINMAFNDNVLDYVSNTTSSQTTFFSQSNSSLNWNLYNLHSFETGYVFVNFNLNSPLETPPLNPGDILNFTATITGATDENPMDNIATINQIVTDSLDPNDKICAEGTTVAPSAVGNYVHYIINFENDGTANAQNIVVKDMIDTTKYDVSTLVPIKGSAPFTTRITNTNQVEFIFQNINLPYTTGSNDGYVAFKIKTLPTLVVGDTFSNTANIYFDYNAPIVTNTATTTIAALANPTFAFSDYFTLSPIPTKGALNINTKQDITISSISIYNTLGQVMLVTSNPSKTIDVSNLTTGSYFIKVITDKGTSSGKFIKE